MSSLPSSVLFPPHASVTSVVSLKFLKVSDEWPQVNHYASHSQIPDGPLSLLKFSTWTGKQTN